MTSVWIMHIGKNELHTRWMMQFIFPTNRWHLHLLITNFALYLLGKTIEVLCKAFQFETIHCFEIKSFLATAVYSLFFKYRGKQNERTMLESTFLKITDSWVAAQFRAEIACPLVISFCRLQALRSHLHLTKEQNSKYKPKIQKLIDCIWNRNQQDLWTLISSLYVWGVDFFILVLLGLLDRFHRIVGLDEWMDHCKINKPSER